MIASLPSIVRRTASRSLVRAALAVLCAHSLAAAAPPSIRTHTIALGETLGIVARDRGIDVVDVDSVLDDRPGETEIVGTLGLRTTVYDALWWDQSTVFLAGGSDGVLLVDVSDPAAPEVTHRVETRGSSRRLGRSEDILYVADDIGGLVVIDAARPKRSGIRRTVSTRSQVQSLAIDGEDLAIAEGIAGVRVFDIERADQPREISRIDDRTGASDVAISGDTLLVAAGRRGLVVYTRGRRGAWTETSRHVELGRVADVAFAPGPRVLVGSSITGLVVYDFVDPGSLRWVSEVKLPRSFPVLGIIATSSDRVLIAAGVGGVAEIDLSEATRPRVLHPRESSFEIRWSD